MARPRKQDAASSTENSESAEGSPHNAMADAFAKIEPRLASVAPEELGAAAVDIAAAVAAAVAAAPRIREHREAIAEQLPKHPIELVDELETYAHAAQYAHLVHVYASGGPEAAKNLLDEAVKLREGLLIAAEALAHRGLLDADAVADIRKGSGNADTGNDLSALASLFHAAWGKVSAKTAVERHEIDRARELGPAVLAVRAARRKDGKAVDTEDQRARAFALLSNAYDRSRQAIAYVRWKEGDVDAIAPSLTKKRPGRKPGGKKEEGAAEGAEPAS